MKVLNKRKIEHMLAIIKYIKENGLDKAISTFKLKARIYDDYKVHLKYNQIESDMSCEEVQDCRGLILEMGTWRVMSMAFRKFFNSGETHAAKIDWNTAHILEKLDGSLIQLYFDDHKNKWFAATTGTAEGEGEVNNKMGTTFNDLFFKILKETYGFDITKLNSNFTYVFELTTPYNIVVKPHGESSVTLLAIRGNKSLHEFNYDYLGVMGRGLGIPVVKSFDLNKGDFGSLIKTFEGMPWSEEGYVVVDGNFNRVKIKNPAYLAVHHLKGKTAEHNILTIVKTNEIEEFASTFPERRDELFRLKANYDDLIVKLNEAWVDLTDFIPKNITASERKKYATAVFDVTKKRGLDSFTGLYFGLHNGKIESIKQYMTDFDDKILYKML